MIGAGGILLVVALVAAPVAWAFWRGPRYGKFLTPLSGGHWHPVQFRPGPPPLPEHDEASVRVRRSPVRLPELPEWDGAPFPGGAVGARG